MRLITKTDLAATLQCTARTIHNYHAIALIYCDDYEEDYPVLGGERITSCRLTEYQVWLLRRLYLLGQKLASRKLLPEVISTNKGEYSKAYFEKSTNTINFAELISAN